MNSAFSTNQGRRLVLCAATAADMMSKSPMSLHQEASIHEAATFLITHQISAAPVIDDAGRPVGVLSHTDIVRYACDPAAARPATAEYYRVADLFWPPATRHLMHDNKPEHIPVKEIMTPTVLSVTPEDSALSIVAELLALKVHRLFVIDETGVLVGVISTFDVLRKLQPTN